MVNARNSHFPFVFQGIPDASRYWLVVCSPANQVELGVSAYLTKSYPLGKGKKLLSIQSHSIVDSLQRTQPLASRHVKQLYYACRKWKQNSNGEKN